ncbi:hypothetical protein IAQ61_005113 [Plenodomus lingam]|uniref:uncharacterized protein n=1 Tax=Leptosphaeria maculans TaxID=5022 RepID=UPI003323B45F|nr:hypothetical protein IAQ61_005113 [Plenodomus lingam]
MARLYYLLYPSQASSTPSPDASVTRYQSHYQHFSSSNQSTPIQHHPPNINATPEPPKPVSRTTHHTLAHHPLCHFTIPPHYTTTPSASKTPTS